jgi:hypothetical protein
MSSTATERGLSCRTARATSEARLSWSVRWFASPVSGSLEACAASFSRSSIERIAAASRSPNSCRRLSPSALSPPGSVQATISAPQTSSPPDLNRSCDAAAQPELADRAIGHVIPDPHGLAQSHRRGEVAAGAHRDQSPGRVRALRHVGPGSEHDHPIVVLEPQDPRSARAGQLAGFAGHELVEPLRRTLADDRRRHPAQRDLPGRELLGPPANRVHQALAGVDRPGEDEIARHRNHELGQEQAVNRPSVVEQRQRLDCRAGQEAARGGQRRVEVRSRRGRSRTARPRRETVRRRMPRSPARS